MNYTQEVIATESSHEYGIQLDRCEYFIATGEVSSLPIIYDRYTLTFILKGKGSFLINETAHSLSSGDAVLITPKSDVQWSTSEQEPITFLCLVLVGKDVKRLLHDVEIGTDACYFHFADSREDESVKLLYAILNSCRIDKRSRCGHMGHLYFLMDRLQKRLRVLDGNESSSSNDHFQKAVAYIEKNFAIDITVSDIAAFARIDRTYLYKIFMNEVNISPKAYLIDYRLQKAVEMMVAGVLTNTDIAVAAGFYDYSHFSHTFQKKYKTTPAAYRESLTQRLIDHQ